MKEYVPPFTGPLADFPKDPDVPLSGAIRAAAIQR